MAIHRFAIALKRERNDDEIELRQGRAAVSLVNERDITIEKRSRDVEIGGADVDNHDPRVRKQIAKDEGSSREEAAADDSDVSYWRQVRHQRRKRTSMAGDHVTLQQARGENDLFERF